MSQREDDANFLWLVGAHTTDLETQARLIEISNRVRTGYVTQLTDERIDDIAELVVKGMEGGIQGFCSYWGWKQFSQALLEVCGVREKAK